MPGYKEWEAIEVQSRRFKTLRFAFVEFFLSVEFPTLLIFTIFGIMNPWSREVANANTKVGGAALRSSRLTLLVSRWFPHNSIRQRPKNSGESSQPLFLFQVCEHKYYEQKRSSNSTPW